MTILSEREPEDSEILVFAITLVNRVSHLFNEVDQFNIRSHVIAFTNLVQMASFTIRFKYY